MSASCCRTLNHMLLWAVLVAVCSEAAGTGVSASGISGTGISGTGISGERAEGSEEASEKARALPETSIGVEGTYYLRSSGTPLEVKPRENDSPLLLRIADVVVDGDTSIYEIRYMGFYPGEYDLRDFLIGVDGNQLASLPPAMVSVVSVLPAEHSGELTASSRPALPAAWPYRTILIAAGFLWITPLLWYVTRRLTQRRRRVHRAESHSASLADRLEPLVVAVLEGRSTPRQQAELERLLLNYWRDRLELHDCTTQEALRRMHEHDQARVLLRQLDTWLHMPPGRGSVDLEALLAPYRHVEAASVGSRSPATAEVIT